MHISTQTLPNNAVSTFPEIALPTPPDKTKTSFSIGPYHIQGQALLAPMAGVTDLPFRNLCRKFGAGLAVSEMVSSDASLRNTRKSKLRIVHDGEKTPVSIQIVGTDPKQLAEAARYNVGQGAEIIDINMGCPAKKVCKKLAGSALMKDEKLVEEILTAVVKAVSVPVTLKIRTGWSPEQRNAPQIARIAEDCGIQALAVHGRTRACRFNGEAEYATIRQVSESVSIPVIANGDISSPEKAKKVLDQSGATCIMIGRGAQGRPWIFQQINHYLEQGILIPPPTLTEQQHIILEHLQHIHRFYGESCGVRIARKHIAWYTSLQKHGQAFRQQFNGLNLAKEQIGSVQQFYERLIQQEINAA
ncbi:MAG: tRNA dihydrouridine synthase DusB [Pseudomonadales bacterium]|nr:tRNA dihydrouridine synthase DusB [Pseudomonadales bacterium]